MKYRDLIYAQSQNNAGGVSSPEKATHQELEAIANTIAQKTPDQHLAEGDIYYLGGDDIVFVPSKQSYRAYVLAAIHKYDKQSLTFKIIHHTLQLIIMVGAALAAILISIPAIPKVIPTILSGSVAVATVVANYYKFGQRGRNLRFYAEDMALEYNRFNTKREPYKDLEAEEAQTLFMSRIEKLFQDQRQRLLELEKLQAEQK